MGAKFLRNEHIGIAVAVFADIAIGYLDQGRAFIMRSLVVIVVADVIKQTVGDLLQPDRGYGFVGVRDFYFEAVAFLVFYFALFAVVLDVLLVFWQFAHHQRLVRSQVVEAILLVFCPFEAEVAIYTGAETWGEEVGVVVDGKVFAQS